MNLTISKNNLKKQKTKKLINKKFIKFNLKINSIKRNYFNYKKELFNEGN